MKRTRLNLAALRGTLRPQASEGAPTLTELLSAPDSATLSRRELLGLAGVAAVSMPPMVKQVGPSLLGRFELVTRPGRVAFKLGGRERWAIDTRRFAGGPRLHVDERGDLIRISLTGARYPGTSIPADLTCQLQRGLAGWRMRLWLKLGDLTAEVPLGSWLAGAEPARGRVKLAGNACALGDGANLRLSGIGQAEFLPDWRLRIQGTNIASLSGFAAPLVSDVATIALLRADDPSIIEQPPAKRSSLVLERGQKIQADVTSPGVIKAA